MTMNGKQTIKMLMNLVYGKYTYSKVEIYECLKIAIEALKENEKLKNRCSVLTDGNLCLFCTLECEHRNCDFRNKKGEE